MGAVSLQEDSVERYIESNRETVLAAEPLKPPAPNPVLRYCPLCVQGFLEESSLDQHVSRAHGKQYIYLKVNDCIVRDICWLSRTLEKCDLIAIEIPVIQVEIEFNGTSSRCSIEPSAPSLMGEIPAGAANGLIRIKVRTNHFARQFQVYLGRQPDFHPEAIDEAFSGLMERMRRNRNADLEGFRRKWLKEGLNELERRYLDGVLEYCHGWLLEEDGSHAFARDRLEAAMNLLLPFKTELAEDIRSALSLRMNVFGGRWGCDAASPFFPAEAFFCCRDDASPSPAPARETRILIGAFSQRILEAIAAYNGDNDRGVFAIINNLQPRDRNDEDKIAIIEARTRHKMGDRRAAAAYETLLDHPLFGNEALKAVNARQ